MRKYSWIVLVFAIIVCTAFGLAFPYIIFSKNADISMSKIEKYEIEPVEIGETNSVLDAMKACVNGNYAFEYQEDLANLSRRELIDTCNSFFDGTRLAEYGLFKAVVDESNMTAKCSLVVMNKNPVSDMGDNTGRIRVESNASQKDHMMVSAVLWTIHVEYEPDCFMEFSVDDRNGKVVHVSSYYKESDAEKTVAYGNEKYDYDGFYTDYFNNVLIPFLSEYYGTTIEFLDGNKYSSNVLSMTDKNDDAIIISLSLRNGSLEMAVLN